MAGTIPLSMTQQLDEFGAPLAGGKLYIIQAGTTSTPQIAYQDSALTIPVSGGSTITLDASGRLPQFFLADGSIKIRLTDVDGSQKLVADGIIVTGASSGGGGGSPVDPTTVLQPGWLQPIYGTGIVSGFVRANGRTIGSATSGATERANADTLQLFSWLYAQDTSLVVSGGRGASAAVDYAANKTIALPDYRGCVLGGLDDMGTTARGLLTTTTMVPNAITLGALGGAEGVALNTSNLPPQTPAGVLSSIISTISDIWTVANHAVTAVGNPGSATGFASTTTPTITSISSTGTFTGTPFAGQISNAHANVQPTKLTTIYIKL